MDFIFMLTFTLFSIILVLFSNVQAQEPLPAVGSLDITKFGAKPNEDSTEAIMAAWKEACGQPGPTGGGVRIPKGTFIAGPMRFEGPCKGRMKFTLQGILEAPLDIDAPGWLVFSHVHDLLITGGGTLNGKGQEMWKKQPECLKKVTLCKSHSITLRLDSCDNTVVRGITSLNSKNFHMNVIGCNNATFEKIKIVAPAESPNTDGIHVGRSNGVTIIDTTIATGDDCISVGDGMLNLKVINTKCGPGHGISVGSLGLYKDEDPIKGILVQGCTLTNTDNGVRIKSWPDKYPCSATDIKFIDIKMENVSNPVIVDQMYCPYTKCNTKLSAKVKLDTILFKGITGTTPTPAAVTLTCLPGGCKNVELANIDLKFIGTEGPAISNCTNIKPLITGPLSPPGC
ncbi:Pectin lyase-like superfamily protein [Euphorbia peplus]|nr:Pectin lyase-like superfamily protein [Euphorbia peplus]